MISRSLAWHPLRHLAAIAGFAFFLCLALAARAEEAKTLKGVALVIGQSKYAHITPLTNPANDAREMVKLLTDMGFDARSVTDRDAAKLTRDLERFAEDAEGADVAFLYYSGHGIEAGGENYLVPVNADESSLANAGEALVPLSRVIDKLKATVPVAIVLLDACRTSPFPAGAQIKATPASAGQPITAGGLGAPRGASVVETTQGNADNLGTVIGFAAEPGRPALDGAEGGNSPYAAALLRHLSAMQGAELSSVMRMVTEEVYLSTETRQRPWVNESLRRLLYLGVAPDEPQGEEGLITGERRQLLLTIADLPSLDRQRVETIAKADGVPLDALFGILRALGAKDMPEDPVALEKLLKTQADKLKKMMEERDALKSDDPEIKRMIEAADRAIRQGAIATARQFLDDAVKRVEATVGAVDAAEEAVKQKRLADAAVYARRAEAASLAFDHQAAAKDYAMAFSLAEKWDEKLKWNYKNLEAEALNAYGYEKGDNASLDKSVAAYEQLLTFIPNGEKNDEWAITRNNMGVVYQSLGERDCDTKRLKQAAQIFRESLEILTLEHDPVNWAAAQNNLGNSLLAIGQRESNTQSLEDAVAAFRAVLAVRNREKTPADWSDSQNNLGIALYSLAERENNDARLLEALAAYRAGLEAISRDEQPLRWGTLTNNLGNTLNTQGARKNDIAILKQAADTFRAALEVRTRERVPLQWASSKLNLANALQNIGLRNTGTVELEEAAQAYRDAALELTRERSELGWASAQNNLGGVLQQISTRTMNSDKIEEAITALRGALGVYKRDCSAMDWAMTQLNLGNALQTAGKLSNDMARLYEAVTAYQAALGEYTFERTPMQWATAQSMLGTALEAIGFAGGGPEKLKEAVAAKRAALTILTKANGELEWAQAQFNIGNSLNMVGNFEKGTESFETALTAFNAALEVYTLEKMPLQWAMAQNGIGDSYWGIGTRKGDKKVLENSLAQFEKAKEGFTKGGMIPMAALVDKKIAIIQQALAGK
ncbi:caspase family protein [Taklimakanibacter lacteus]|uniref:caspase family protein n=1 Tax=Taklimakanibacter lacteus TaxID=2268456 RepID=UPI0034D705DD